MIHYVYKIINLKNKRYYIGSRSHPDPKNDDYMSSSKVINNLYKLEGIENFKKEILKTFNTREKANEYEDKLINESLKNNPKQIYNLRRSGCKDNNKNIFNKRNDVWEDYYNEIRNKYLEGIKPNILSKIYNCDRGTIDSIIKDLIINNKWSNAWKFTKEITYEYNEGCSRKSLSKKYKCDIATINSILLKNNTNIRSVKEQFKINKINGFSTKKKKNVNLVLLKEYYLKQNLTLKETANKLNIGIDTLKRILLENNIPIKSYNWSNKQNRHPAWGYKKEIKNDLQIMLKKDILKKYNIKDYLTLNKILKTN
jgi:DNA invertase Pin-like site-specific DNA recombinase